MSAFPRPSICQYSLHLLPSELQEPFFNYCFSRSFDFFTLGEPDCPPTFFLSRGFSGYLETHEFYSLDVLVSFIHEVVLAK